MREGVRADVLDSVVDKDEIITESFFWAIKVSCNFGNSLFLCTFA